MELMPGGDYTSVVCGGLKMAFDVCIIPLPPLRDAERCQVAHQLKERRDTILGLFRRLPSAIEMAGERLQEHPDDERLFDAVTRLYIVVLESIETMLTWLVDKSTCQSLNDMPIQVLD